MTYLNKNAYYEGEFVTGLPHDKGTFSVGQAFKYEGDFVGGTNHSFGCAHWVEGSEYTGKFHKGAFHGDVIYTSSDGKIFKGFYKNGLKEGPGTLIMNQSILKAIERAERYNALQRLQAKGGLLPVTGEKGNSR